MKKGFISILSAVCMLMLLMSLSAGAAEDLTYGEFTYEINDDGESVTITKCETEETVLDVPAEINGLPVTEVDELAFAYCGMTTVNYNAKKVCGFYNCSNLQTINFGENVEEIAENAFVYCSALESITIPDNINTINCRFSCENLKTVTIGKNSPSICKNAFTYTNLTTLYCNSEIVPSFANSPLTTVYLGDNVKIIGELAFADTKLENIEIPDSVHTIGELAFADTKLENIEIPDNVHTICDWAFENCVIDTLTIGKGVVNMGGIYASYINTLNYNLEIVYGGFGNVKNVNLGNNVKEIDEWAFCDCTDLETITLPDSVEIINEQAFFGCTGLKKVILGKNIKRINRQAFKNCTNLTEITVPDDLQYLGDEAFCNTAFWYNDENWDGNSCYLGSCLVAVLLDGDVDTYTVKDGVTLIADSIFEYDENGEYNDTNTIVNVGTMKIPASVKYISGRPFYTISNIVVDEKSEYLVMDNDTLFSKDKTVLYHYFEKDSTKTKYIIPDTVKVIAEGAFGLCDFSEVVIPDSVTTIEEFAFESCFNLKSVSLGNGIKSLGFGAFLDCYGLTNVYYNGTPKGWSLIYMDDGNTYLTRASRQYGGNREPSLPLSVNVDYNVVENDDSTEIVFTVTSLDDYTTAELDKIKMYIAEYDENGALINIYFGEKSNSADDTVNIKSAVPTSDNYKILLWDGINCPLINAISDINTEDI